MATGTEGFFGGVLATLAAIFVLPKVLEGRTAAAKPVARPLPARSEDAGYYVLEWFGPARGKPDAIAGPWTSKASADRYDRKAKAASKRIREPLSTRVRYIATRTAAHNARP